MAKATLQYLNDLFDDPLTVGVTSPDLSGIEGKNPPDDFGSEFLYLK